MINIRIKFLFLFFAVCGLSCTVSNQFPMIHPISGIDRNAFARERAENYFIKARDYDRRGLHQMAEHFYELAYKLDPESDVLRNLLVQKYLISNKYEQALILVKGHRSIDDLSDNEKRVISNIYIKMGKHKIAAETLEKLSQIKSIERGTLGYLYERIHNNKKAIENYTQYYKGNPESLNTGFRLARLYIDENMLDQAESLYVFLDSVFDEEAKILNGLGTIKLLKHDTASAVDFFKTALMMDSTSDEAMNNIAQIYIARRDYSKAIDYYKKMTKDDYLTKFYYSRTIGLLYYYDKQYSEAEKIFKSLLSENIDDYELHFYLGLVFAADNRVELAEIELRKAVALKDDHTDAWLNLCYLFLKNKDWDKALEVASQFKEKEPDIGVPWQIYGYLLNIKKRFKEAIDALHKALSLDKNDIIAWFELGNAYERTGSYRKAADSFKKVLSLKPDDAAAANYLGYMWAEQNRNLDSAKMLIELALKKDPDNGAYLDSYGWIFFKLDKLDKAEKFILEALEQIDDDPVIYSHLGDILAKKGNTIEAIQAFKKSIELDSEEKDLLEKKIKILQEKQELPVRNDVLRK